MMASREQREGEGKLADLPNKWAHGVVPMIATVLVDSTSCGKTEWSKGLRVSLITR